MDGNKVTQKSVWQYKRGGCNGVQREHNKKLNNGLPILHKVPPKRDYGRYFCIMAEKGGTSHGGLTEKLSLFFHAKKQKVNALMADDKTTKTVMKISSPMQNFALFHVTPNIRPKTISRRAMSLLVKFFLLII